ncbi:MAG: Fe-S cluster assembly protein SufD [Planctomycetes bacterium]|nr:Fe-S cluster assembly protein SufD [Planctomycetota bacterium]
MTVTLETKDLYLQEFERAEKSLPGAFLKNIRRSALERFSTLGFPSTQEEDWRFTDVAPLAEIPYRPPTHTADTAPLVASARGPLKDYQIAFVDGRFTPDFSSSRLPSGVTVGSLASFLEKDPGRIEPYLTRVAADGHSFTALNTALHRDGAFVHVRKGARPEQPIHLLFLSSRRAAPFVTYPRVLAVIEEGARAMLVQSFIGPAGGTYFTNAVTELSIGDGAVLDYTLVQRESHDAFHIATIQARQGRNAALTSHSIALGARLARTDLGAVLNGEGAECTLNGLYEATGHQHVDNHTTIDHATPHGTSRELYKGILDGKARGVFDGRIVVRPQAQKTNAIQTNKNLLLSKEALVHTKPQLEIFANDVKCKHGATIGQLDRDVLFYLRSRGIGPEEARRILIHAFAGEIIDKVQVDAIRNQLGGCIFLMVPGAGKGGT